MSPKKNNSYGIFPYRNLCCITFIVCGRITVNPATACLPWNSDWNHKKQWGWFLKQWVKFCFTPPKETSHIHSLSWTCIEVKCWPWYHLLPASVLRNLLQNGNRSNENLSHLPWWTLHCNLWKLNYLICVTLFPKFIPFSSKTKIKNKIKAANMEKTSREGSQIYGKIKLKFCFPQNTYEIP